MRVLAISDIHSKFHDFEPDNMPDADICVVAGDVTEHGNSQPKRYGDEMREARVWLASLGERFPTFVIPGNHDIRVVNSDFNGIENVEGILNRRVEIMGYSIYGVSMCPTYAFPRWAKMFDYMTTDPEVEANAYNFPAVDIVVSHSPPYGFLDTLSERQAPNEYDRSIGSDELTGYILRHKPTLVVCGHVHNATGDSWLDQTYIVNVATEWRLIELE